MYLTDGTVSSDRTSAVGHVLEQCRGTLSSPSVGVDGVRVLIWTGHPSKVDSFFWSFPVSAVIHSYTQRDCD